MASKYDYKTTLESDQLLEQMYDIASGERLKNGEQAAVALLRHTIQKMREYQSSEVQDGSTSLHIK